MGTLGTTVTVGLKALDTEGQCNEVAWPYGQTYPSDDKAEYFRAEEESRERLQLVPFIQEKLDEGKGLLLALRLTDAWYSVAADGLVAEPGPQDQVLNSHAVTVVGYDAMQHRILIRNSWSDRWGDGGHAWLPESYVSKYGFDAVALLSK